MTRDQIMTMTDYFIMVNYSKKFNDPTVPKAQLTIDMCRNLVEHLINKGAIKVEE